MATDKEIDEIYDAVDILMSNGCFGFLNEHLSHLVPMAWRMDLDILLAYVTATLPAKSQLASRARFLNKCMELHPTKKLWKGLE